MNAFPPPLGDFDISWRNPSPAQDAAFEMARHQKVAGMTEFQVAEFIALASRSLWYTQAKSWIDTPPPNVPRTWPMACGFLVRVVDLGYDASKRRWWNLALLGKQESLAGLVLLMDFGYMLKQYRKQSDLVVSQGFEVFIAIVCGRGWERRYKQLMDTMSKPETVARIKARLEATKGGRG